MAITNVEFIGFAPDLPDITPGVFIECHRILPDKKGFAGAPNIQDIGVDALAARCSGIAAVIKLDDTNRLIAGTTTKLYERSGTSWSDVTRVSGGDYTGSLDIPWRFAQVGNVTLATNKADTMQFSISTGAFADISGGIKAAIVETVGDFVMAFDTDDGSNNYADGWHCSALGNYADWTEDIATQSASGRLLDVPGRVRAGRRLGPNIVAYKQAGAFLGTYIGGDIIWAWQLIPGEVGAVSQESVVEVNMRGSPAHIIQGFDDFYMFDGSRPVSIGEGVREYYQGRISSQYAYRSFALHDPTENTVRFYYDTDEDGLADECLVYNYYTGRWGSDDREAYAAVQYIGAGITWDGMGSDYSTWDDLPDEITYDSPFWSVSRPVPAIVYADDDKLYSLTGVARNSNFRTGYMGDFIRYTTPQYVYLQLIENGLTSCDPLHYFRESTTGKGLSAGSNASLVLADGRFDDVQHSAKWHSIEFDNLNGDYVTTGMTVEFRQDGEQ